MFFQVFETDFDLIAIFLFYLTSPPPIISLQFPDTTFLSFSETIPCVLSTLPSVGFQEALHWQMSSWKYDTWQGSVNWDVKLG